MSARPKTQTISLSFQKLEEHHLPAVVAIESSVYAFPWTHGNFRDSLYSGYDCIGAWCHGELVGYTITVPALEEMHLLNVAVAKHCQGRGVGAAILQHVIDRAGSTACEVIYLEVRPSNIAGLRLYERFGFRQLGLRRDYYPAVTGREDALFLGLNIKAPAKRAPR
ncbi:MAG: ribosomal protein S18-alanine N-acetyltransferase [Rhodocyclaceae bacterium]|nr:ribosomal protein S18-alanine N-acetyltransferase [Rhodocyclaceae bacterium]MCA3024037.1 ribosomal protein S18-alanine N-acetyltransferase [Rhodocyclaceae bacterium]MCA3026982.1 ribosomal protein S18-alanine N-acetyltransferase [Rhodocyclaceae bacterium]MCA3031909.1 ribosomal protein S18-alanine N-acetyltransferase [Rhodocyclaceae bacterium]MCA3036615.1 ribosomal protein S18-alanine N-acetyltransferase [Rhodocyclaceae bacterium]